MAKRKSKREKPKLIAISESFGEYASMCFAKFKTS